MSDRFECVLDINVRCRMQTIYKLMDVSSRCRNSLTDDYTESSKVTKVAWMDMRTYITFAWNLGQERVGALE